MEYGISTSCFYPELTENSVLNLAEHGIKTIELFLNTYRETKPDFSKKMKRYLTEYQMKAISVHPFTSGYESMLFFSEYPGRFEDGLEHYRQLYFDFMHEIGAKILVLHGCIDHISMEKNRYYERFAKMRDFCKREGIILAQENVAPFKSHSVSFIRDMKTYLHGEVEFVLDIKQAVRAGEDPFEMMEDMGENIVHTHISDHTKEKDCLPIGEGDFDFAKYFKKMQKYSFSGAAVIELYRSNFGQIEQLYRAYRQLELLF